MVVAFGVAESPEGDSLYAYPARESLWSPNGVAKIMQGAKPVRLAAEAFLLFVQKEPKYAWGCAPRPPNAKLRLDTNDVNIVRTAPQIRSQGACGAFYFGFCRDRIKNQPYKRRLAPDSGGRRPSGRGVPTRWGSRGPPRVTFGYFSSQKSNPPPGRRAVCHPVVTPRRRQAR